MDMTQDTFDKLEALMRKVIRTSGGHLQGNAGDIENVINFLVVFVTFVSETSLKQVVC